MVAGGPADDILICRHTIVISEAAVWRGQGLPPRACALMRAACAVLFAGNMVHRRGLLASCQALRHAVPKRAAVMHGQASPPREQQQSRCNSSTSSSDAGDLRPFFAVPKIATPSLAVVGSDKRFPVRRVYCVGSNYRY